MYTATFAYSLTKVTFKHKILHLLFKCSLTPLVFFFFFPLKLNCGKQGVCFLFSSQGVAVNKRSEEKSIKTMTVLRL